MRLFLAAVLFSVSALAQAKDLSDCKQFVQLGTPKITNASQTKATSYMCKEGFAMQYSSITKSALWVAEYLKPEDLYGEEERSNDFRPDPELNMLTSASLADYEHSGFDRGHLAPAADFSKNPKAMSESFYLSNMTPQEPSLNRGLWQAIEKYTRRAAKKTNGLFVITGPIYNVTSLGYTPSMKASSCPSKQVDPACNSTFLKKPTVGKKLVFVPDAYYKILINPANGWATAFVVPNMAFDKHDKDIKRWLRTIREVEQMTNLDFNTNLDKKTQDAVEQQTPQLF